MTDTLLPITATMLVKNSARYLPQVLDALHIFDEVLLLDNGSTDDTLAIAARYPNVSIHHHEFIGFGAMKNLAASLAKHDWIFSIDSDEILTPELQHSLQTADLSRPQYIYTLSRLNHYRGRLIQACGWYPDILPRLYHRAHTQFSNRQVHEAIERQSDSVLTPLTGDLLHYSFDSADGLIQKMQHYSTLYAEQYRYHKHTSIPSALLHGITAFIKHYGFKSGWRYGGDGFTIAVSNALGSFYKYIKLNERNQALSVSLIITTYNRPDALGLVLESAVQQTVLPKEIIVADDGSGEETAALIRRFQATSPVPILHSWQEDDGFRAAQSRNRALAQATGEYIVLIDGDMVLHPQFIRDHIASAQLGVWVQGSRVLLTPDSTQALLRTPLPQPFRLPFYHASIEKKHAALRCAGLRKLIGRTLNQSAKAVKSCNMGFFLADAQAVNGFNNDFVGWGREDSEFAARLYHSGLKRRNLKFGGIAYHLWHHEAKRDALPQNDALLQHTLNQKLIRCENGMNQFTKTV